MGEKRGECLRKNETRDKASKCNAWSLSESWIEENNYKYFWQNSGNSHMD